MAHRWIAQRMGTFDSSGIRRVFDLARSLKDPINLSIGQPHFDVPEPVKDVAIEAIRRGRNAYSVTQGIAELNQRLRQQVQADFPGQPRELFITSGTSGALMLAILATVNPGDEVILFDPYFVMYPALVGVAGGRCVTVDTYPDFRIDPDKVAAAITPRTKLILFNSPANPTGAVAGEAEVRALAELAQRHGILLVSDEIYRRFCHVPFVSPGAFNPEVLVIDGFSKTYGMTGWRVGWVHGPAPLVAEMLKLQQYSFVCAPQPFQWAALAALDHSMQAEIADYRRKRDLLVAGLRDDYELSVPGGAFYAFPKVPAGYENGDAFVAEAIRQKLLIIPGHIFSGRDTHFRISYAAGDETIQRGVEVLRRLARRG